jgi:hypothetical protein
MSNMLKHWPAYGALARAYADSITSAPLAPPAWKDGTDPASREATWLAWREKTLGYINADLWPRWDEASSEWVSPDIAKMQALTDADLALLKVLNNDKKLLDTRPTPPNAAVAIPLHRQFFLDEDGATGSAPLGTRYVTYDVTLPPEQVNKLPAGMIESLKAKCGSASLQFKSQLQRPRAYQVAKLLGVPHLWELAATSMSPSMSSGHCLQGCMMAAGVYEMWLSSGFAPDAKQRASLQQFAVDIGDRRVFAGVHYPSDNLSSWIIALNIVPKVYSAPEVAAFMWEAITGRSSVYQHISASGEAIYEPALRRIASFKP